MSVNQKAEGFPGQRIVVLPRPVVARAVTHPLLGALLPTDMGYFPNAEGHYRERPLGVDQAIFIYCTRGAGWCVLSGRKHLVQAGDLLVVPPETPHIYGAQETRPWTIHWFHAKGRQMPVLLQELGASIEQPVLSLGEDAQFLALFDEALDALEHGYTPAHLVYASQVLGHLVGVAIWHRGRRWQGQGDANMAQKIARCIDYMKQHMAQPLRVSRLAALANLSSSHFTAAFKRQTGYAPIDFLIRLRMHQACQLMDTTAQPIKEIAARLGYDDPLYFSRLFRQVNELSPTRYRDTRKG